MMDEGWKMVGGTQNLSIAKDNITTIMFGVIVKTQRGKLFCVNMQRTEEHGIAAMDVSKDAAHRLLVHSNAVSTVKSARRLGWKLTGIMCPCNSCQAPKAKQKVVPKISEHTASNMPGKRFYLDLSKITKPE